MKYIGIFDSRENVDENRIKHMSSGNKMIYVSESLKELGHDVDIISPSWTLNRKFYRGKAKVLEPSINVVLGPTIPYIRGVSQVLAMVWLTLYLLFNTKKYETIIVYHSLFLILPIKILQYFKKINLILQVEEIYSEVVEERKKNFKNEIKFIREADSRIFVSNYLKEKIGSSDDVVLYGSYKSKIDLSVDKRPKSLVYAGGIETMKNGAFNAVELMKYIDDQEIKLYILGTGSRNDLSNLVKRITEINKLLNRDAIVYMGKKEGKEYDELMNSFELALNIQNEGKYMKTAFPSKIVAYLSYGLEIVSSNITSIQESPFGNYIHFISNLNNTETAKLIENLFTEINLSNKKVDLIEEYHQRFLSELNYNLENLQYKR